MKVTYNGKEYNLKTGVFQNVATCSKFAVICQELNEDFPRLQTVGGYQSNRVVKMVSLQAYLSLISQELDTDIALQHDKKRVSDSQDIKFFFATYYPIIQSLGIEKLYEKEFAEFLSYAFPPENKEGNE